MRLLSIAGITIVIQHRFPKDKGRQKQWEAALQRDGFKASSSSMLWGLKPGDFDRTGQTETWGDPFCLQFPCSPPNGIYITLGSNDTMLYFSFLSVKECNKLRKMKICSSLQCVSTRTAESATKAEESASLDGSQLEEDEALAACCTQCCENQPDVPPAVGSIRIPMVVSEPLVNPATSLSVTFFRHICTHMKQVIGIFFKKGQCVIINI